MTLTGCSARQWHFALPSRNNEERALELEILVSDQDIRY